MPKTLHAAISFPLPDDIFEQAELLAKIRPHWMDFTNAVSASGAANIEKELVISETKTPPQKRAANGTTPRRRGRPPAVAPSAENGGDQINA